MSRRFSSLIVLALMAACQVQAGMTFKSVTKMEGGSGRHSGDAMNMAVQSWVDGDKSKVQFTESGNPMMAAGSYMLTQDGGKTMYMVNTKEKTYMKWDMEAMTGQAMKMMGGMASIKITDPKVDKVLDEAGSNMLGYPTRHCRFRTTYATEVSVMGMKTKSMVAQDQELWTTTALNDKGFGAWLKREPPKTGNADLDNLAKAQMATMQGFPLKTITATTTTDKSGKSTVTKMIMEVTDIQKADVPASTFALPPSYKEVQMPTIGMPPPGARGGNAGTLEDTPKRPTGGFLRRALEKAL